MRVAFVIFKFFPHGGIARDLGKIAAVCRQRGHRVRVYAMVWRGDRLPGVETVVLSARGVRSHVRQRRFARRVASHAKRHPVDLLVGMNKMPGLDAYYAGDSCFEAKAREQRPWAYRLTPRYRHYAAFEKAVFGVAERTRVLAISPSQTEVFKTIYRTPAHRFYALPPGIEPDRAAPQAPASRAALGVGDDDALLLFVGSGFIKKGLDRALKGVAALPSETRRRAALVVVGDDNGKRFQRLAKRLRISERVRFLGGRDDVPALLAAADGLLLPAYDENTGTVILESAVAGVPALVTANCGYAPYIERANAGIVTPVPFDQSRFNADLLRLLSSDERPKWREGGRDLGKKACLYTMASCAVDALERIAAGDEAPLVAFCAYEYSAAEASYRALPAAVAACREQGMNVRVYAREWRGDMPPGIELVRVPVAAMTPVRRFDRYRRWVAEALLRVPAACVVGFEHMPGIDLYCGDRTAAADTPVARLSRYRTSEAARVYAGDEGEFACLGDLPPGLPATPAAAAPRPRTAEWSFTADDETEGAVVFAMAGADLVGHGFERLLKGLAALPNEVRASCRVLALGDLPEPFTNAARVLQLRDQVRVIDAGVACRRVIEAADVFVDLSYAPTANGWLFDALAAGRAVLTHQWVRESTLVRDADAGVVLAAPLRQRDLDRALRAVAADRQALARWQRNARHFAADPRHYGQTARLLEAIEQRIACR